MSVKTFGAALGVTGSDAEPVTVGGGRIRGGAGRRWVWAELAATVLILALPGMLASAYHVRVLENIAIFALLAMSLNLVFGYTGQVSLGQAAFYALGAYGSVLLENRAGWSIALAWPAAVVLAMLVAWLISFPVLRLRGHYLALATLAFGLIVVTLMAQTRGLTGGSDGLLVSLQTVLGEQLALYFPYVVVAAAVIAYWLLRNLTSASVGRALRSLRDDPEAAASIGVPVARYRTMAFTLAAGLSAVAGILYAHVAQVITPEVFGLTTSIQIVLMVVVGGMGHRLGGVVGAAVVLLIPEVLYQLENARQLVYYLLVLVVLLFMPRGLAGLPAAVGEWWSHRRSGRRAISGGGS